MIQCLRFGGTKPENDLEANSKDYGGEDQETADEL